MEFTLDRVLGLLVAVCILLTLFLGNRFSFLIDISILSLSGFLGLQIGRLLVYFDNRFNIFSAKKAEAEEIRREDDVLLQATGFLQSTIFLYLSLFPIPSPFFDWFKWSIPLFTILFYVVRASAKVRDSNRLRYWSVYIFTLMIWSSLVNLLNQLRSILFVFGRDITFIVNIVVASGIYTFFNNIIREKFRRRYGLSEYH